MQNKKNKHEYLLRQFQSVNSFLIQDQGNKEVLPEVIVSFCTVVEKIIKIRLYKKNPVLVFNVANLKDEKTLRDVSWKIEGDMETIGFRQLLDRHQLIFRKSFSDEELSALKGIYVARNFYIHGYKDEDKTPFDREDILKKMGTVWEKMVKYAVIIFGKIAIKEGKPKNKYSEEELEAVLTREVKEKISGLDYSARQAFFGGTTTFGKVGRFINPTTLSNWASLECPRCHNQSFSKSDGLSEYGEMWTYSPSAIEASARANLYKCSMCNLELTEREYTIAKKLNEVG